MRLDKYISTCTPVSRKDVKKLIKQGAVSIDGSLARSPDEKVSSGSEVRLNGKILVWREFVYIMMNKPQDVVSATEDRQYKTVIDLLDEELAHFKPFPVGRLDIDTEGLLLLTNDGAFAHSLTSPSKDVYKTYFALLDKDAEEADIDAFASGMEFKDFTAKSAVLEIGENKKEVIIKISEGKFHQVKRMCERVGKTVTYLKRIAIGDLKLDEALSPGEYRELTDEELKLLGYKNN